MTTIYPVAPPTRPPSADGYTTSFNDSPYRAVVREFIVAGISIVLALVAGLAWVGQPLRLVQLVTLIGLSMTAGVAWARAVWVFRGR